MKTSIASAIAMAAIAVICAAYVCEMNGGSLDLSDTGVYIIVTDSMDGDPTNYDIPTISKDSLVFAHKVNSEDIKVGDVLGYRTEMSDSLFFHRVVSIDDKVTLKGDAYDFIDIIDKDQIECKVVSTDPVIGKIIIFIKLNLFLLIAVILTSYFLYRLTAALCFGDNGNGFFQREIHE